MPLQDLTPQLRTRLNRMERGVGWFILLATILLICGFGYYIYNTAEQRGWFKTKARYYTYVESGNGLGIGDTVKLMGFDAGRITRIIPEKPSWGEVTSNNVFVEFEVVEPNFGYLWTEGSHVEFNSSGLLGKRELDVTKGSGGYATYITQNFRDDLTVTEAEALPQLEKWRLGREVWDGSNLVSKAWLPLTNGLLQKIAELVGTNKLPMIEAGAKGKKITAVWNSTRHSYETFNGNNLYGMERYEQIALTDRLQAMVAQIQAALPGVLQMTNQIALVLSNATQLTSNLNFVSANARPIVSNLNIITAQLTNPAGSLGDWLIPTNINQKLDLTLDNANTTITNLNTNLLTLNRSLDNVGNITSNLNMQVQANTNIVTHLSDIIVHSDEFIQGLKRFWLFRHLFAAHPAKPAKATTQSTHPASHAMSPKQRSESQ